ncbi:hypothetical protein Trisim1_003467, partial [Trichoderma cf. simile WF8]
CMREMGARRTFRLSGHCLQEGRQAFSFEAMYTIKQASVAGRLNAVIATGLAGVFPLPSATRFMSSKPALPRIWRFLWLCRGLVESGIMPRFAVRCPRLPFLSNIGAFSKCHCYSVPCGSCLQMVLLGLGGFKPRWEVNMHTHVYAPPSMLLKRLVVGVPNSKLPDISMYDTRCSTAGQASEASRMNWFILRDRSFTLGWLSIWGIPATDPRRELAVLSSKPAQPLERICDAWHPGTNIAVHLQPLARHGSCP